MRTPSDAARRKFSHKTPSTQKLANSPSVTKNGKPSQSSPEKRPEKPRYNNFTSVNGLYMTDRYIEGLGVVQFCELYHKYAGMDRDQLAAWLECDRTTVRRWERGESRIPGSAWRAVEIAAGCLGALHSHWQSWRICPDDGLLYAGYKHGMAPGEVLWTWWAREHVNACEQELRKLRERLAAEREQKGGEVTTTTYPRFWLESTK